MTKLTNMPGQMDGDICSIPMDSMKRLPDRSLSVLQNHGKQSLDISNLGYQVDEKGMEWWQRLADFQMPWQWCQKDKTSTRDILQDINFNVKSGQMLAVLGSSGSGKTSLLDAISCQTSSGEVTGEVLINGKPRTLDIVKKHSAYVRQNDRLLPHLTVEETLMFVAQLKLPNSWTRQQIKDRVESVILELGLRHVANSKVGGVQVRGISGGERRRVSIGIQLLLDPGILFLDEPTSGLDSFTAHHLMETLAKLATSGRIVMLTIHQPRSDIFELFDLVMLLSQGNIVYHGKASQMVEYFTELGYPCPELTNPCDFYVDLTTVDMKSEETESATQEQVQLLVQKYRKSKQNKPEKCSSVHEEVSNDAPNSRVINVAEVSETTYFGRTISHNIRGEDNLAFEGDSKSCGQSGVDSIPSRSPHAAEAAATLTNSDQSLKNQTTQHDAQPLTTFHKVNKFKQFSILFRRALSNNLEDYGFLGVQAIEAIFMSLMIGMVFFDLEFDQISVRDRFGLLYIVGALYPYMVILDVIGQYHRERNVLYFEMLDGLYTPVPFFFSKLLSEVPEHTVFVLLYAIPQYFMCGLQPDSVVVLQSFAIVYITVYCSRCLALLSAALLPTYQLSVLFAQSIFTVMLLVCGFIFNLDNIFVGVRWISYISYLKWGNQGLCQTEFPGLNFTCSLLDEDACIWTGDQALELYSLDGEAVWICALAIVSETLAFLLLFYICLRLVSQKPHEQ